MLVSVIYKILSCGFGYWKCTEVEWTLFCNALFLWIRWKINTHLLSQQYVFTVGDSIVAEKAKLEPPHQRGHTQSSCYSYRFFGSMIAVPMGTYLVRTHSVPSLFLAMLFCSKALPLHISLRFFSTPTLVRFTWWYCSPCYPWVLFPLFYALRRSKMYLWHPSENNAAKYITQFARVQFGNRSDLFISTIYCKCRTRHGNNSWRQI